MSEAGEASRAPSKWVFTFGAGRADGSAVDKDLLGGKGANLAEMSRLGLRVPPGFTISTEVCAAYYDLGRTLPDELKPMVDAALDAVGKTAGARFGDIENPLLVSVRSGGRASMPGMMDTVLNLGLNDQTVEGLARRIIEGADIMKAGEFMGWSPTWMMGNRLGGKRLGIIGMGRDRQIEGRF